jgi:hypothetical protein
LFPIGRISRPGNGCKQLRWPAASANLTITTGDLKQRWSVAWCPAARCARSVTADRRSSICRTEIKPDAIPWEAAAAAHSEGGLVTNVRGATSSPVGAASAAGVAETDPALVADDAAREAHQDWREGDAALEVRDVPTSRGGGDTELIRSAARPPCAAGAAAAGCWSDPGVGASNWRKKDWSRVMLCVPATPPPARQGGSAACEHG